MWVAACGAFTAQVCWTRCMEEAIRFDVCIGASAGSANPLDYAALAENPAEGYVVPKTVPALKKCTPKASRMPESWCIGCKTPNGMNR